VVLAALAVSEVLVVLAGQAVQVAWVAREV
jgi:hypothetical protein